MSETGETRKRVAVSGAAGRMGRQVVEMVTETPGFRLIGGADPALENKQDLLSVLGIQGEGVEAETASSLADLLDEHEVDVVVDFTTPHVVMDNIRTTLSRGVHVVVGTTGLTGEDLEDVESWAKEYGANAVIAPNFALGAVLMMRFAAMAAPFFDDFEVIEKHHEKKIDAPSGTAVRTVEMMAEACRKEAGERPEGGMDDHIEKIPGSRGGEHEGFRIHSLRLPGFVAHQEVVLGTEGQTLTIRHDSTDRSSFMPGVKMAVESVDRLEGLVHGLDKLIFDKA